MMMVIMMMISLWTLLKGVGWSVLLTGPMLWLMSLLIGPHGDRKSQSQIKNVHRQLIIVIDCRKLTLAWAKPLEIFYSATHPIDRRCDAKVCGWTHGCGKTETTLGRDGVLIMLTALATISRSIRPEEMDRIDDVRIIGKGPYKERLVSSSAFPAQLKAVLNQKGLASSLFERTDILDHKELLEAFVQ